MGRKQTVFVDVNRILANIAVVADRQRVATEARTKKDARSFWIGGHFHRAPLEERQKKCEAAIAEQLAEQLPRAAWVPRDLPALAGRELSPSERIRHQQTLRKLEGDGLVVIASRHVRLTEAGLMKLGSSNG